MKRKIFMAAAILFSSQLFAQDSSKALNEVVITATKFPIKQSATGKVLTVIDREELNRNSGRSVSEILTTSAGLIINGASNILGTNQDVYLRGAAAGKTLILIDGVPNYDISGISGSYDLNFIPADMIERIEILKGSQSTLYGSDAIAGVINIITRTQGTKKISPGLSFKAGSYDTYEASAGVSGKLSNTGYSLQLNGIKSKGFSSATDQAAAGNFDKDGFKRLSARLNLTQRLSDKLSMKLFSGYTKYDTDLDNGGFTDDRDYTSESTNWTAGIGSEYKTGENRFVVNYNYNDVKRTYIDDSLHVGGFANYSEGKYLGKSHFAEAYSNIKLRSNLSLLAGADFRHHVTDQFYSSISMFGPYETALGDTAKVSQLGLYASLFVKDLGKFNFELGARYNNFSEYGDVVTYSFNPYYQVNNRLKIFSNIGTGFKAPSLYQVYGEYKNPNADLKPERSLNIEGGIEFKKQDIRLRAVYFSRSIEDNIVFYSTGAPDYLNYYVNADKQKDKGIEIEASMKFEKLRLGANYINLDGKIETKSGIKDTSYFNLYRRPRQTINLKIGYDINSKWQASLNVQSVGKRKEGIFGGPPVEMPAYYTWNLYSDFKVSKNVRFFVDLNNITDEEYSEVLGYNSRRFNFMGGVVLDF